jgi:hypothetical protein
MSIQLDVKLQAVVLYDYEASSADELLCTEGQTLHVLSTDNAEWTLCRNPNNVSAFGYVPSNYLRIEPLKKEPPIIPLRTPRGGRQSEEKKPEPIVEKKSATVVEKKPERVDKTPEHVEKKDNTVDLGDGTNSVKLRMAQFAKMQEQRQQEEEKKRLENTQKFGAQKKHTKSNIDQIIIPDVAPTTVPKFEKPPLPEIPQRTSAPASIEQVTPRVMKQLPTPTPEPVSPSPQPEDKINGKKIIPTSFNRAKGTGISLNDELAQRLSKGNEAINLMKEAPPPIPPKPISPEPTPPKQHITKNTNLPEKNILGIQPDVKKRMSNVLENVMLMQLQDGSRRASFTLQPPSSPTSLKPTVTNDIITPRRSHVSSTQDMIRAAKLLEKDFTRRIKWKRLDGNSLRLN